MGNHLVISSSIFHLHRHLVVNTLHLALLEWCCACQCCDSKEHPAKLENMMKQ